MNILDLPQIHYSDAKVTFVGAAHDRGPNSYEQIREHFYYVLPIYTSLTLKNGRDEKWVVAIIGGQLGAGASVPYRQEVNHLCYGLRGSTPRKGSVLSLPEAGDEQGLTLLTGYTFEAESSDENRKWDIYVGPGNNPCDYVAPDKFSIYRARKK